MFTLLNEVFSMRAPRMITPIVLLLLTLTLPVAGASAAEKAGGNAWTASWIWQSYDEYDGYHGAMETPRASGLTESVTGTLRITPDLEHHYDQYNDTIEARRAFEVGDFASATLRITADSFYRLFINGQWVNDGPCRSWPSHYQYDVIDVAPYLKPGKNEISVIAKFFGIGAFHQVPIQAGLLAQLDVFDAAGHIVTSVGTDSSWEARNAACFSRFAPKQCVQMGPYEIYDARLEGKAPFSHAAVRYAALDGFWKDLTPRDCPLLTKTPFSLKRFVGANIVCKPAGQSFVFPTAVFAYDGVVGANNHCAMTGAYATLVDLKTKGALTLNADGQMVFVDGTRIEDDKAVELEAGKHFVSVVLEDCFGHWRTDSVVWLHCDADHTLKNPLTETDENPWCYVALENGRYQVTDMDWSLKKKAEQDAIESDFSARIQAFSKKVSTLEAFKANYATTARPLSPEQVTEDVHGAFKSRAVVGGKQAQVDSPEAAMSGVGETVVRPSAEGDTELVYDLGEQNIGCWQFDVDAEAGAVMDIAAVEYIAPDGRVQHTERYRNSMRYICKAGENRYTSLMRRSGRYLFVTFRNLSAPAKLKNLRLIESTYPVRPVGRFECADSRLNRIWEISARTLKLCMEDTYTDCPLYEQTHWVGDARNESIISYTAFGSGDLGQRCARLTAYSLETSPITLSQTPSTWKIAIPAFSFLWTMSVWENYFYTGDKEFLAWAYPYMIRNLKGAEGLSDAQGLFSAPFWNMFDWAGIDDRHDTVTHNSLFAIGAVQAALRSADALGDTEQVAWLQQYRDRLLKAVNALWDDTLGWYPDSVHEDGKPSSKTSVHTGFLSLLYDIAPPERREAILQKVLTPPEGMTKVGSPFAVMYLLDALEKSGQPDAVVRRIYDYYQVMLDMNATTVWESYPGGTTKGDEFPTRSHCHGWSAAPIYFLNRSVLGITPIAVGGAEYRISPRLSGLEWAKGASCSVHGPVEVSWRKEGDTVRIDAKAPKETKLTFERNDSLKDLKVEFNGQPF
jgi:hypothetical protein